MENSYICVLILFLLKILEKLALFIHAVITKALCRDKDDIIRELLRSFLHNYQEELKIIKGSDFVFESVKLKKIKHKTKILHHSKKTGKILNKTMSQLLLMFYLHHKIVQK